MMKMIEVTKEQMAQIAPLFAGIEDSMVKACLQGYMGNAYVVTEETPKAALIISGEYSFFGGDADSDEAKFLMEQLFTVNPSEKTVGIFADTEPKWEQKLLAITENNPVAVPRFGIVQKDYQFDEEVLQKYIQKVPAGFELVSFDEAIYDQAMAQEWSQEFCETFATAEDFLTRGFGFAMLKDGQLVAGASTMTVYDGGIEIQVATEESYRRMGLAMPCAAALVRECAKRGIRPCWDAANLISKKMALKLGYEYKGEYTTIHMSQK